MATLILWVAAAVLAWFAVGLMFGLLLGRAMAFGARLDADRIIPDRMTER